jgi:hypothetical protein
MNYSKPTSYVGIVSYDAGGAEVVSSYVKRNDVDCMYCLSGPAVEIFNKKLGVITTSSLEKCLAECDWLLCGTGASEHEWRAITAAKEIGKRVIVFLDHWTAYKDRFIKNGKMTLPDEIWVGDTFAKKIGHKAFPGLSIKLVPNPYWADINDGLNLLSTKARSSYVGIKILYVCEPTWSDPNDLRWPGYTDHEALRYFLECISEGNEVIKTIAIRPHPSEPRDKYAWVLEYSRTKVTITDKGDLLKEIVENDWIVGRSSMALVIGLIAGKKVVSCIPPGGERCSLPYKEICHL